MNQKEKAKFRSSIEWKEFRAKIIEERLGVCECCGINHIKATRKLSVHHKDSDKKNYSNISNKQNFSLLCSVCHKIVHQLEVRVRSKKHPTTNEHIIALVAPHFLSLSKPLEP